MINVTTQPFELSNLYYDLFYKDKDYQQEAKYVGELLKKYHPKAKYLIELGSGTGNYSEHLSSIGYNITGIERNERMNEIARGKAIPNFLPLANDIVSFDLGEKCEAVVALFHVISYLTANSDILSCFKQVTKHLHPGGLFIFDVWYSPAVYTQVPENRTRHVENEWYSIKRKATPTMSLSGNAVAVNYDISITNKETKLSHSIKESHVMRHFSTPEIDLLAGLNGMILLAAEEFLTAKEPGTDTWGVCYILKKYA